MDLLPTGTPFHHIVLLLIAGLAICSDSDGPPVIIEHPLDVTVSKGSPATLNCAARPSNAQITWFKDGVQVTTNRDQVTSHRIILDTGALFLLRVNSGKNSKDADAGSYYCVAKNEHGEAQSREGVLKIAMLREDFRTRPHTISGLAGDKAVMECSPPRGFPEPVVSWRKDDKELRIDGDDGRLKLHPDGNLIIEPVQHSDSGTYVCVASNVVGERVSPPARLSVFERPKFVQEPKDMVADVGSSALFDCRVSGEPQPQISWKKANSQMPQRAYIAKDNRGLRIDRVQLGDEGEYICHARNPAGAIEASARLRVQASPTFIVKPLDQHVEHGGKATFDCTVSGQPAPTLYWSREGGQDVMFPGHISPDGRIQVSSTGQLSISDVRPHDEGVYVCLAVNSAGGSPAKAELAIKSKTVELRAPPIIEHGPANQTFLANSSAILPCQATGRIPPKITWLMNGIQVDTENDNRIIQHSGGSLHIADLRAADAGVYVCRAQNEDGESTWTASLAVEERTNTKAILFRMPDPSSFPSVPGQPQISNIGSDAMDLTWSAPEKSGAGPITGYMLQYYSPEEAQTWYNVNDYVSGTKHRVRGLKPASSYLFVVRAENEKGIGPPSIPSAPASTKPAIARQDKIVVDDEDHRKHFATEQAVTLLTIRTVNSTAVRLFWARKDTAIAQLITGYFIKWRGPNNDAPMVNVSGASSDSALVGGLRPYTNYEFFVIPYMNNIQGVPSNSKEWTTDEAPPSLPPSDVRIRMLNMTTLRISWRAPPADGLNGVLKGFQIVILGKGMKFNRNITTNEKAASVTLFHLIPGMTYKIRVSARTGAGIGVAHGTDVVEMSQDTLDQHMRIYADEPFFYSLMHTSWFLVAAFILLWIVAMGICVVFFLRRRRSKSCSRSDSPFQGERMGPFIKINDGSVHMSQQWVEPTYHSHTNPRLAALNGTLHRNGQALYSMTPNPNDFYNHYHDDLAGTLGRPGSEPQYHYAQVTNGPGTMSTFYGNHYQDDPSPYATTTLVTTSQQPAWLSDKMLRGPALPSNPVPNGPPARFANEHGTGRRSRSSRGSDRPAHNGSASDSPPHTDISYIQSSDGTGGSSNGKSKVGTMSGRRSPPRHNLADFIPPPPSAPPPLSDYYGSNNHNPEYVETNGKGRPTSRNRNTSRPQRGNRDDESQRFSLMDDDKGRMADSSEADEENSDNDQQPARRLRPAHPQMGVSASTLSQITYDNGRSSTGRFKSMQRSVRNDDQ